MKTQSIYFKLISGNSIQNMKTENTLLLIGIRVWQVLNSFRRYLQTLKKLNGLKYCFSLTSLRQKYLISIHCMQSNLCKC